jgi:hypothetical protein
MTSFFFLLRKYWILFASLVAVRIIGSNYFHFYDDAYITLRYARNLIEGNGFVFNPGEWILGITTPLWGLVGAVLHLLPTQIEYSVLGVSILADIGTMYLTMRVLERSGKPIAETYFALFFIASGVLTRIGVSGMESSLFLFMACLALSAMNEGMAKRAVVIASIAYFIRPEAVLLVGAIALWPLISKRDLKLSATLALISAMIVAPVLWMLYHYYGTFIPQSVLAKSTVEKWSLWMVIKGLMLSDPLCFVLLPLTIHGAVRAWKSEVYSKLWVAWIVPFALAYLISRPPVFKWYGEPVHYAEMLFSAYALQSLFTKREASRSKLLRQAVVNGLVVTIVAFWAVLLAVEGRSGVQHNMYYGFRDYFSEHPIKDDTLLCGDIGAVGYYSEAHIIDPYGLVTPDALKYDSLPADVWHYKPKYFMAYEIPWMIGHFNNNPWMLQDYQFVHHFDEEGVTMDSILLDESKYPPGITGFFLLRRRD